MKLSVLDMVQDIANDLETDEINSINDTVESQQIAQILKTSFFELIGHRNWAHLKRTFQFESISDPLKPTHIKTHVLLKELVLFNYNKKKETDTRDKYGSIIWYEPEEFLLKTNGRDSSQDNIQTVVDFGGIKLYIRNDKSPEFCTSFDDEHLILDSWDSSLETTIQGSNTQAIGYVEPTWEHVDGFIPDLPSESFPALLAEAKSTAFIVLKQQANEKAEQKAQRQHRWLSRKDWTIKGGVRYPNYGRRKAMPTTTTNPLFEKD